MRKGQFAGPDENKVFGYEALKDKILDNRGPDLMVINITLAREPR